MAKFKDMSEEELLASARYRFSYDEVSGILTYSGWVSGMSKSRIGSPVGAVDGKGYLMVHFHGKHVKVHQIIWLLKTGKWPTQEIDHDNRVKTDNFWSNLYMVSSRDNQLNRSNNVPERYVYFRKDTNNFSVKLYDPTSKKSFNFGSYSTLEAAISVRDLAEGHYPDIESAYVKFKQGNLCQQ